MNKSLIKQLYFDIWNGGKFELLPDIVSHQYTIHSDPVDTWEGKTLTQSEYIERVMYSRHAFPDLAFSLNALSADEDLCAVRWTCQGTHKGELHGLPTTGKVLSFVGQTFYQIQSGRITGHWQVTDRLGFYQQIQA